MKEFVAPQHSVFTTPQVGSIVAFWTKSFPGGVYLGCIEEMEYLNEDEGTYYTIQTNNGSMHGCFEVTVLASCMERRTQTIPFNF